MLGIRRPAAILTFLTALNLLNYLDRFVLAAVLPRVSEELGLSNFVGGALATLFLLGYFATSPVFGLLADRMPRKPLLAIGVLVWSLATIGSGLAQGAALLLVSRALVGVGEASYATLAPTILDDVAPRERRGRWLAVFYAAIPVGSALGFLVGGLVERHAGWRNAFLVAGIPGILLAAASLFLVEPARGASRGAEGGANANRGTSSMGWASLASLGRLPLYRRAVLGYAAQTFAIGGFGYWAPTFLYKRYGLDLATANVRFGAITVVAGGLGTALGGFWGDRWVRARTATRDEPVAEVNLRVCAIASLVAAPVTAATFLVGTPGLFFAGAFVCELGLFLSTSPINLALLRSVPVTLRASGMALSIFAIHLLGDLWSPPLLGLLQDQLPIPLAMMAIPVAIATSAALWWGRLPAREESTRTG